VFLTNFNEVGQGMKEEIQQIIEECNRRGCPALYQSRDKNGLVTDNFLRLKSKARKENPDLAKRWDKTYKNGFVTETDGMDYLRKADRNSAISGIFAILITLVFIASIL